MSEWWILDNTEHKRGPLNAKQVALLLHLGTVKSNTQVFSQVTNSWMTISSCDLLQEELFSLLTGAEGIPNNSIRLPISQIPPLETVPCQDSACSFFPSCDLIYIWDRDTEFWLSFDEYVTVCREAGLVDGLPDRLLACSGEQIRELLFETDKAKVVRKQSFDEDEPLSDPEKEAKRQKRRSYRERKKLRRDAGVFLKGDSNPNVYVSSLPLEISESDLESLFKQAGLLKQDLDTGKARIKLYGHGDALITYMHPESVSLAIERFNDYEISPGCRICVQLADFSASVSKPSILTREELETLAELNRESRKKKLELYQKERKLKSAWETTVGNLPILVFQPNAGFDCNESLLREYCEKFSGSSLKIKAVSGGSYWCVKFPHLAEAETCLLSLDADVNGVCSLSNFPFTVFMHDGRDLTTHSVAEPVGIAPTDWAEFLENEADSDDEDIQIRTEE